MKEIKIYNPDDLEVTLALIRPKTEDSKHLLLIAVALYSPPRSRKKSKLINFLTETYHLLKIKYPSAYFIFGGDINDLKIENILSISVKLKMKVTRPTRQTKILSVIITDLHRYYDVAIILSPIEQDTHGVGKASDHSTPVVRPHLDTSKPRTKQYKEHIVCPLPESKIRVLGC